jgi:SAM-dependent methyltransferase
MDITNELKELHIECKSDSDELEIRFGSFTKNLKFFPRINLDAFTTIINFISTHYKCIDIRYERVKLYKNGLRSIEMLDIPKDGEVLGNNFTDKIISKKIIKKNNVRNIDIVQYGLRLSLSSEKVYPNCPDKPLHVKNRKRLVYQRGYIKIDISMFQMKPDGDMEYDCEVEVLQGCTNFTEVSDIVHQIIKIIQKSNLIMTTTEICDVKLGYRKLTGVSRFIGSKPETLSDKNFEYQEYAVTHKLDGERWLLFIIGSECYLLNSIGYICKLGITIDSYDQSLFDGELFNGKFYCFDVLFLKGRDIRKKEELRERLDIINTFSGDIKCGFVVSKEYIFGNTWGVINDYTPNVNTDGIILVAVNKPYSYTPLKWKPDYLNTIDFKIKKLNLNTCSEKEHWKIFCSGDTPFSDISEVSIDQKIGSNFLSNTVVEFKYENSGFTPLRQRFDKKEGNYIKVAENIFENILNPFDIGKLKLKRKDSSFYDMRRYHNFIKRRLLEKHSGKTLLDLACGKGGDIGKWADFNIKHVTCYDINEDSITEALKRYSKLKNNKTTKNFEFNFGVADLSKTIVEVPNSVDTISCFFAIHYFYKDYESLKFFIKNTKSLKKGGRFLITTLDKDSLEELNFNFDSDNLKIKRGDSDNSITVYIKDSVLNAKTEEYLVDYTFTVKFMENHGFKLIESFKFDHFYSEWKKYKNSLVQIERRYSFLNRFYVFEKISEIPINL